MANEQEFLNALKDIFQSDKIKKSYRLRCHRFLRNKGCFSEVNQRFAFLNRRAKKKLDPFFDLLTSELELIQKAYFLHKEILGKDKTISTRVHMLIPLLHSIQSNAYALGVLLHRGFQNEAYILFRPLYERCLNYCYLTVAPEEDFRSWLDHSFQKNLRLLRKELVVGNFGLRIQFGAYKEIWDRPKVAELMKQYQRKVSGKETHNWSKLVPKRTDRIEWLSKNQSAIHWEPFVFAELMFFEEASEAMHGTFYGTAFHKGFFEPRFMDTKHNPEDHDASSLLLGCSVVMMHSVLSAGHERMPIQSILSDSRDNAKKVGTLLQHEIAKRRKDEVDPRERLMGIYAPEE